jgi:hypothetical protein
MKDVYWESLWQKRGCHRELYLDVLSNDAFVPTDLSVPNCDCGKSAWICQSKHPDMAACCFYTGGFNVCSL